MRPHDSVLSTSSKCREMSNHLSQLRHSLWEERKRDRKDVSFYRCVYAWNLVASCAVKLERHFTTGPLHGGPLHGEPPSRTPTSHPNQLRAILITLMTPTTTWLFAGYLYTTRTQKAEKISQLGKLSPQRINERLSFHWFVHKIHVTTFPPMAKHSSLSYKPTTTG